jgi:outer membrane protein assembly factor BamD
MLGYNNFSRRENNKLDQTPVKDAKKYFELLIEYYPHSKYAIDAREKIKIINNYIAGHELYVARNYLLSQSPIGALNRLKLILKDYPETVYAPEAFYRLTEAFTALGLYNEAAKYSVMLQKKHADTIWSDYSAKLIARKK